VRAPIAVALDAPDLETAARWAQAVTPHVQVVKVGLELFCRTGLDALELVLAGASAVSVGTAVFGDPGAPVRVLDELTAALQQRGFERFSDAVGYAHRPPEEHVPEDPDPVGDVLAGEPV